MLIRVPAETIVELEKIQKRFIWTSQIKIKSETISSDFKEGVLKMQIKLKEIQSSMLSDKKLYGVVFMNGS